MPDISVKVFRSTDTGAPNMYGAPNSLIDVFDACLVNGFGSVTLNSLVVSSNVATGTVSTGHGFTLVGSTGPVIRVAGAAPSGLNGDFRIASIPSATTFTFATTGISDQTATGTITAKRAPAGFAKTYSGTNKAAYRSDDVTGTIAYLRVDDSSSTSPLLNMYETMSDVDTGSGISPNRYYPKAYSASSTPLEGWRLISDSKYFYLFSKSYSSNWYGGMSFGDINSYKSNDAYKSHLKSSQSPTYIYDYQVFNDWGILSRSYSGLGSAILASAYSNGRGGSICDSMQIYPSPVDNSFHGWPVEVWEATSNVARGIMPGLWNPIHKPGSGGMIETIISDIPQLPGRELWAITVYGNYVGAFDITGPWR